MPTVSEEPERAGKFFLVLSFPPTLFPARGKYTLKMSVDGVVVGTLPLYAIQANSGGEPGIGATIELSPATIDPAQDWYWTPEWQAGEQTASAEIVGGQTETFANVDDFLADLDR